VARNLQDGGCTIPTVQEFSMRRKIQIVLVITFLVAALACSGSYFYLSEILRQRVAYAHDSATHLGEQLAHIAAAEIPDYTNTLVGTSDPTKARLAIADYLAINPHLNAMLESVVSDWPMIQDAAILDGDGKAILHSIPGLVGKTIPNRPDFQIVQDAKLRRQLRMVYNPPIVYDVSIPLLFDEKPFGTIHLGVSTVFLRSELTPRLQQAVIFSGIFILLSLILAAGLSYIALGPSGTNKPPVGGDDESGLVTLKIVQPQHELLRPRD
jgi:hypothetical protein